MSCRLDECNQGHCQCPAPEVCNAPFSLRRYVVAYMGIWIRYQDHAAAKRAGHLAAITQPEPDGIEFVGREPMSGEAKLLIVAVTVTWAIVLTLSFPDAINTLWPQILAVWPIH